MISAFNYGDKIDLSPSGSYEIKVPKEDRTAPDEIVWSLSKGEICEFLLDLGSRETIRNCLDCTNELNTQLSERLAVRTTKLFNRVATE